MLGTLAMKKVWQNKRKAAGKDFSRPNIVMNSAVQVCWEKAARYFDIEEKYVNCTETRYVIDPEEAVNLVDENTIGEGTSGYHSALGYTTTDCRETQVSVPSLAPPTPASTKTSKPSMICSSNEVSIVQST